ncbi:MAG: hypothetical protein IPF70_21905 [Saprospiraceae bacterium]|nr:hypothetical protein [Saprospiraceae bacterium]
MTVADCYVNSPSNDVIIPPIGLPDRTISFNIPDSTVVMGGFSSGGMGPRNWVCNKTILCGDIDQDGTNSNNSYHVVTTTNVSEATVVDGFCITGGKADGTFPSNGGGGWYNNGSGSGNRSNPTLNNIVISGNVAAGGGGGMFNYGDENGTSSPILTNVVISGNIAGAGGGGILNSGLRGTSSPILTNVVISGNIANRGGGMFNYSDGFGSPGTCSPILTNVVISGNNASSSGGGMYNDGSLGTSRLILTNSILWNNSAPTDPIISENDASTTTITYSIIQSGSLDAGTTISSPTNKPQGTDPLFVDAPLAGAAPTAAGDFHLTNNSPVIDMGDDAANTYPTDLDGKPRIVRTIDMGAYEFDGIFCGLFTSGLVYVDSAAIGMNDGSSWTDAFKDLQDALLALATCQGVDTIKVAKGTYYPSSPDTTIDVCSGMMMITPANRAESFNILDSTVILGGYLVFEGIALNRDPHCNKTILCGEIQQDNDNTNNSYHVVTTFDVSDQTVVDGFCITGGRADEQTMPHNSGGGWYNDGSGEGSSNPTIVNCQFIENMARNGGAMINLGTDAGEASPQLINCEFLGNSAANRGGAMVNDANNGGTSSPECINCIFSGNKCNQDGGAVFNSSSSGGRSRPDFINCSFNGNLAVDNGGAMYNNATGAQQNSSNTAPRIGNSIFWNNAATIGNVFLNRKTGGSNAAPAVRYCIIQGGPTINDISVTGGNDNITMSSDNKFVDPLFMMAPLAAAAPTTDGDFHVMFLSPAIDMGNNSYNTFGTDLDGLNRIVNGIVDIGPYEKLLNCDTDTLYVNKDGSVPDLPVDSLLLDTIPEGYHLIVMDDGVASEYLDTESIPFDCDDKGANDLQLWLTNNCDTIDLCHKIVVVLDTFPKDLVGNDQLNVSLDQNCMKVLGPDDLLQNVQGCRNAFEVTLIYPYGTNTYDPPTKVDISHVGYCMVYSVRDIATNNKTWGRICVEDKAPPRLNCANDTVSCFEFNDLPLLAEPMNDCSGDEVKLLSDKWVDWGCDSAYLGYVERTIWGSDRWKNSQTCTSTIYIKKTSLDSVDCPQGFDFPCTITHQLGSYTTPKELKVPIQIDQKKLTPEFLLSLQKATWEFKDGTKDKVLHPSIPVVPNVDRHSVYLAASGICKINATYTDKPLAICGTGVKIRREWTILDWCTVTEKTCVQYLSIDDKVAPVPTNKELGVVASSPHDCGQYVDLPALAYKDCNDVKQTYSVSIQEEGITRVLSGDLPAGRIWLPVGYFSIDVRLVDACYNESFGKIEIAVVDITPPTPICIEVTQTTVDPATCWTSIAAKDLDNGSRDNCCNVLHFAAAPMDSITYWRNYWNTTLETEVGKEAFWKDKDNYDALIEDWINCYVFSDTVHFDECGTNQVVLRVYEACGVPRFDPHIFPCSPHAWFCYNTYLHLGDFNYNWFDSKGPKSCNYRPGLTSISKLDERYAGYYTKGYFEPKYIGGSAVRLLPGAFLFPQSNRTMR